MTGGAAPRVAALILAAGRSARLAPVNKLLADYQGTAIVRHVAEAALASRADPVFLVTGHQHRQIEAALSGLAVTFVHNQHFADGLGSSLRCGLGALGDDAAGVVVCLGDMPRVGASVIDRLIAAFDPGAGRLICVPTWQGRRGNPVLLARCLWPELLAMTGEAGARVLFARYPEALIEVAMTDDAVLADVDTPEALVALTRAPD